MLKRRTKLPLFTRYSKNKSRLVKTDEFGDTLFYNLNCNEGDKQTDSFPDVSDN